MGERPSEQSYDDAAVEARLAAELPHWRLEGGTIRRTFRTAGWKSSLMVVTTIGHLAETAWHHPEILLSYSSVEVRLTNHAAKGITDKDFELARKIEEVVLWRPAEEAGSLEGTPADPRFAYLKYDA